MTKQYKIGAKMFFKGNEITITSEPYELYGAMWQDGVAENGKALTVKTPNQHAADVKSTRAEWEEQQAGFTRLKINPKHLTKPNKSC